MLPNNKIMLVQQTQIKQVLLQKTLMKHLLQKQTC